MCFLARRPYRRGDALAIFTPDLQSDKSDDEADGTPPWLNETEFLERYRMHHESLWSIVGHIKDHPVFVTENSNKRQAPVAHQLMVFLYYIGRSGRNSLL